MTKSSRRLRVMLILWLVLLLEMKGDFPGVHERDRLSNYTFEVMQIEERRISKIKVTVHPLKDNVEDASSK